MEEWVTLLWSLAAGICLAFALLHLYIWLCQRVQLEHLLFAIAAFAIAVFAYFEWSVATCQSIERCKLLLRWGHVPASFMTVCLACFMWVYLRAGRWWLLVLLIVLRIAALALNFTSDVSVNYAAVHGLSQVLWLNATFTVPETSTNPMTHVGNLGNIVLLIFVVDAAWTTWRRGDRRKALLVPGAAALFTLLIGVHVALMHQGLIRSPYLVTFGYLMIITASGLEISGDILKSAQLTRQLQQRESELVESEQRLSLAAEAAHLGMWVWDIAADRFWSTDGALALFGMPPDSRPCLAEILAAIHPDDRQTVRDAVDRAMNHNDVINVEYRTIFTPDKVCWVASRGLVEFDDDGRPQRMRGVSVDITPQKTAELEASHMHAEIAHLSRVTMLGELSGSIAHELNQPLAAILSNAEAAESMLESDSADPAELREMLADIVEQDVRAGEVIRRLRALLKKGEVEARPLDVNDLVREAIVLARNDLINRGVHVSQEFADGLPAVCADRVQLQQVLLNLVVNACEAMVDVHGSQRMLTVRTGQDEQGLVRICVIDRGQGIPEDQREAVFDPFYTTKATGMGLGLAVSRTIIQAHGGRIWAQANPGRGTEMCVVLPASEGGRCESVAIDNLPGG